MDGEMRPPKAYRTPAGLGEGGDLKTRLLVHIERWVGAQVRKNPGIQPYWDDLLAAAALKMLEVLDKFGPDPLEKFDGKFDKLSAYVRLSTRTAIVDFLRNQPIIRAPRYNPPAICEHLKAGPTSDDPPTPLEDREVEAILWACAKDDKDRAILMARWNGGPLTETVEVTGISRNTIRKRLAQMLARYEKMTS